MHSSRALSRRARPAPPARAAAAQPGLWDTAPMCVRVLTAQPRPAGGQPASPACAAVPHGLVLASWVSSLPPSSTRSSVRLCGTHLVLATGLFCPGGPVASPHL